MVPELVNALSRAPLFAVLRGLPPSEAIPACGALIEAGVSVLEVTLDSPAPYESLHLIAEHYGETALVAAGTTLTVAEAEHALAAGARMIVAPNFSPAVVSATRAAGAISCPGVMTPTEAFAALEAGADCLKLFPGDAISPKVVTGMRAVLPSGTGVVVTGGVDADNLCAFLDAGANGVGIGSALYRPGKSPEAVYAAAEKFVALARRDIP
ncbi:MAG: 2-dehydro-3-deoxy-6-phosphogalactonate aldolase [Alphaproteobacteria bacterium]